MKKTLNLTHAVLASSLFLAPYLYAAGPTQITGVNTPAAAPGPFYSTTITGNIEIIPAGQVNSAVADGIHIDSPTSSVVLDANNTNVNVGTIPPNGNAILITAGAGAGISVLPTATQASITVNLGSNINTSGGTGDAIDVNETSATITNSGLIFGNGKGINIKAAGTNATITNSGGTIKAVNGPAILLAAGASGLTLTNSAITTGAFPVPGVISATGANDAIQINAGFTSITNSANSTISAVNGNGINIATAAITGDIENAGTITSGTGNGIAINAAFGGMINNNSGGTISNTGGGWAVGINNSFNVFNNNAGATISSPNGFGIVIFGNSPGTVTNAGTIQDLDTGYYLDGTSTGLINTGTITTGPDNTVWVDTNSVLTNGIVNSGNISNTGGLPAIFLGAANVTAPLFQNGGTITGNVILASNGDVAPNIAFTMTGGTIVGNVTSSGTKASTLQLNGGTIKGNVTTGNVAGNTVNLTGTTINGALNNSGNNDIFNLSGGSFTSLTGTGTSVVNVIAPFTSIGTISIPTLNVTNAGTVFNNNNTISNVNTALNINANATMNANANVTGTGTLTINPTGLLYVSSGTTVSMGSGANAVTNNGTLAVANNGILQTGGAYVQSGNFAPSIQNMSLVAPFGFGQIDVGTTATFNPGSTIEPELGTGTFILNNYAFPVVQSGAPIVNFANVSVVHPSSAILSFTLNNTINPNDIYLVASTYPLALVAQADIPLSIAATLDPLVPTTPAQIAAMAKSSPLLLQLLGQLQLLPNITAVSDALELLAPSFNYALPGSTRIVMNNAFDSVQLRLEGLRGLGPLTQDVTYKKERDYELYNGVNYGDSNVINLASGQFGAWVKGYGEIDDQNKRHEIEGYKAAAAGFSIGGDWTISPYATIGVAESINKVNTKDSTEAANEVNIDSYQTTFYGWFQPMQLCSSELAPALYVDAMLGVATHAYSTLRNIEIGTINAQASANFYGLQYGAQMDIGYAFISTDDWYVAPLTRLKYTYLNLDNYTETGADGLSLSVINNNLDEMIAGVGIRLGAMKNFIQAIYFPEFSVMLLYDFAGSVQQSQANFLAGGNPFYTDSIKPAQYIQLYGLSINAYTSDNYLFTLKVNFEHRDHFYGYDGFIQLHYEWDK